MLDQLQEIFLFSGESILLRLSLNINLNTVLGATWLNWTPGIRSRLIALLSVFAAFNAIDAIPNGIRSVAIEDANTTRAANIGLVRTIVEWTVMIGVISLNMMRFVHYRHF